MVQIGWGLSSVQEKGIYFGFLDFMEWKMVLSICNYMIGLSIVEWDILQNSFEYMLGKRVKCSLKCKET